MAMGPPHVGGFLYMWLYFLQICGTIMKTVRACARLSVKVSLYDNLLVDVREVFEDA